MSIGISLLLKMVREAEAGEWVSTKSVNPDFFVGAEVHLFEFITQHRDTYGVLPKESTLEEHGVDTYDTPEPYKYYYDKVVQRYTHTRLAKTHQELGTALKSGDTAAAYTAVSEGTSEITMLRSSGSTLAVHLGAKEFMKGYIAKQTTGHGEWLNYGWPYLDTIGGGLLPGDVYSIVGRPGSGKTFSLLHSLLYQWGVQEKPVMLVSMEMSIEAIMPRIVGIMSKVCAGHIKSANMTIYEMKQMVYALDAFTGMPPFWVIDGNLSGTVADIYALASSMNPAVIAIDGAYLVKHSNRKLGRWDVISENAELIKRMTSVAKVPTMCTWQFNRGAVKKKNPEDIGLEDIYGSDAIGQVSSVVVGLFDDSIEGVTNLKRKTIQVLKGRGGERGSFPINWTFMTGHMDFSEYVEPVEELDDL